MTVRAATPQRAWQAAGVRHEIFMRILPALRHDMAGPLSVARMGNAMLKRYLAASPIDLAAAQRRVEQGDGQLQDLLDAIRSLSRWDLRGTERRSFAPLLATAVQLARPLLDLHSLQLTLIESDATAAWGEVQPARGFYAVLGALCFLQDGALEPAMVEIESTADLELLFRRRESAPSAANEPSAPAIREDAPEWPGTDREAALWPPVLQIDQDALASLSEALHWPMTIQPEQVVLHAPLPI